jgi:epsin
VVIYFRDNLYVIKTLREFQFIDEYGKDQGANVRQKAKDIVNLLQDEARLRHERKSRAHMRDRMVSGKNNYDDETGGDGDNENSRRRSRSVPPARRRGGGDEDQLRRAIEESKRTAAEEQARMGHMTAEELDLAKAIRLSEEEENKRNKAVEDSNANSLFDDTNQLYVRVLPRLCMSSSVSSSPQSQQGFGLIDPTAYATGLQPQFTAMQPQFTSFNPYQQQAQQEAMQVPRLVDHLRGEVLTILPSL